MENAVQTAPIQMLSGTLEAYEKLLEAAKLAEQHLQTFLDNNPILIEPSFKGKWTKGDLRRFRLPEADFLLKSSDNSFVVVELDNPTDRLLNASTLGPSAETADGRNANYELS